MGYYSNGVACRNGHWITASNTAADRSPFCAKCGAAAIDKCDACNRPLKGAYNSDYFSSGRSTPIPSFCENCSKPWPWTAAKIAAIEELAEAEGSLTEFERESLSELVPHLINESPRTQTASFKVAALVGRLGAAGKAAMLELLKSVAVDAAKKTLGI